MNATLMFQTLFIYLVVLPYVALLICDKIEDAQRSVAKLGLCFVVGLPAVYVIIGVVRLVIGLPFIW